MKLISFSLFGTHPIYLRGALANARLAPKIYPGWAVRFHCGAEVPTAVRWELETLGCQTRIMPHVRGGPVASLPPHGRRAESPFGMFWRFLPASDSENERVIIRDCDSRLNVREKAAVDEWVCSGKTAHAMRDHDGHRRPLMGGLWGIRGGVLNMEQLLEGWEFTGRYCDDQWFLECRVWPLIKNDTLCHGWKGIPFPPHLHYSGFVGQIVPAHIESL